MNPPSFERTRGPGDAQQYSSLAACLLPAKACAFQATKALICSALGKVQHRAQLEPCCTDWADLEQLLKALEP